MAPSTDYPFVIGVMESITGPGETYGNVAVQAKLLCRVLPLDGGMLIIDATGLRVVKAHENPEHGLTRTLQEVRVPPASACRTRWPHPHAPGSAAVRADNRVG